MKIGFRTPSLKKKFKAHTSARAKRAFKGFINPTYGKFGVVKDPKRSVYNKIYRFLTFGLWGK